MPLRAALLVPAPAGRGGGGRGRGNGPGVGRGGAGRGQGRRASTKGLGSNAAPAGSGIAPCDVSRIAGAVSAIWLGLWRRCVEVGAVRSRAQA